MFFGTINTDAAVTSTFQEKDSFVNSVITTVLEHNIYTTESIIYTMKHNENEIHENFRKKNGYAICFACLAHFKCLYLMTFFLIESSSKMKVVKYM